jgi:MFS transporter, MFS domain-containing protein family, molybdate-anion transporter
MSLPKDCVVQPRKCFVDVCVLSRLYTLTGTHLYVLYESYGYSVASLYCLGFFTGGILSPVTGPMVDKMGRKKAAMLYCALEVFINMLEQYPHLAGLVVSRMIGGFTTNLLHSVFETWLDTEYRKRGFCKEKYEILMRDSIIVSNLSAIISGYLSHILAERYGVVGPFRGAVTCTAIALVVVASVWTENYGGRHQHQHHVVDEEDDDCDSDDDDEDDVGFEEKGMIEFLMDATNAFKNDKKMLRVGIIQGLSSGCLFIFVFLWAPMLIQLAHIAPKGSWGLDSNGEPAFGLIFGAFMAAGVFGGIAAPPIRKMVSALLTPKSPDNMMINDAVETEFEGEGKVTVRPMAVEFLAACCYFVGAIMLLFPCTVSGETAFSRVLAAFLFYEFMVGVFLPCEGVIRSLYFPAIGRASIMAIPNILVNAAVSFGVLSTNFVRYAHDDSPHLRCFAVMFSFTQHVLIISCISISLFEKQLDHGILRDFRAHDCFRNSSAVAHLYARMVKSLCSCRHELSSCTPCVVLCLRVYSLFSQIILRCRAPLFGLCWYGFYYYDCENDL